jgi:hypothetical protein
VLLLLPPPPLLLPLILQHEPLENDQTKHPA